MFILFWYFLYTATWHLHAKIIIIMALFSLFISVFLSDALILHLSGFVLPLLYLHLDIIFLCSSYVIHSFWCLIFKGVWFLCVELMMLKFHSFLSSPLRSMCNFFQFIWHFFCIFLFYVGSNFCFYEFPNISSNFDHYSLMILSVR